MGAKRVLLFCPTYELPGSGQLAIRPETEERINQIQAHNGANMDLKISANNPRLAGDLENVLFQYQLARAMLIQGGYDELFIIEHDILAPVEAYTKLAQVQAPVVYGVYYFRHFKPVLNTLRHVTGSSPGMSLTLFPEELAAARRAVITPVSGAGFGCTLIRREVLERLEFRRAASGHPVPDMPLAEDLLRAGIDQAAHFGVLCKHYHKGIWLDPDPDKERLIMAINVKVVTNFVASIGGQSVALEAGQVLDMDEATANEYIRAGYLARVRAKPAVKVVKKPTTKRVTKPRTKGS